MNAVNYKSIVDIEPVFRTSSSRNGESPRDDEVVIVVPTDREDTPPRLATDSSGLDHCV